MEAGELNHPGSISSLVDLLSRNSPGALTQLREQYPHYANLLEPGRLLGESESGQTDRAFLIELVTQAIDLAKKDSGEILSHLHQRMRMSMRLRIMGSLV